jgi:hypothetical protein
MPRVIISVDNIISYIGKQLHRSYSMAGEGEMKKEGVDPS